MAKVIYAHDVALLSFQVLGLKPEKGKTPLIWTQYVGVGENPFQAAVQVAQDHGFRMVEVELPEDIAWRGSKTKLNENGKGGTVFTAEIKIIHSARLEAPPAAPVTLPVTEPAAEDAEGQDADDTDEA